MERGCTSNNSRKVLHVLGHEFVGTEAKIGEGFTNVSFGDDENLVSSNDLKINK
ncbi:D-arabinose 1-dehydrogenase-like Zn-dependent alcohol dehydrogenase [Virgibacillus litoralis]|uniref:D-arabinose 1-dehydrogenase-like Zn-dependent alcohol dehydrogenase n=1 Tax=Virgibacillus litoralis TaxID=578221 RepID=A0ABS4H8R9_9BACI|nr:D-arabinose 1-dehydrogenase-like Zn-dependent alcohol dehydrogenase [Virgibacillus litoralis]